MKLGVPTGDLARPRKQVPAAAKDTNALDALIAAASSRKGVATKTEAGYCAR